MTDSLASRIRDIVGADNVLAPADLPPPAWDTRQPFRGRAVIRPGSTAEVSALLDACNRAGQTVVPMGGLTGLVQGCRTQPGDYGLSLDRLDAIEDVDPVAQTMTAQAGVTLARAQAAAAEAGLYFPVDIGARDNCQLGGNAATNAGGTRVIRYGMMRHSVLGLEAVLADGTLLSSMNRYLKNNSGFDLKQLFIGTEGTLGIITRLVLKLDSAPRSHNVALLAASGYDEVVNLLTRIRAGLGATLCGYEVMWNSFYRKAVQPEGNQPPPLAANRPFYVLVEATGGNPVADTDAFEETLFAVLEDGLADDGVMAKSDREREALWAVRHEVEWLVRDAFNFDVSLRVADAGDYVASLEKSVSASCPGAYVAAFGHLGDNNLHLSILGDDEAGIQRIVYETLRPYDGAISAEHGIGLEKKPYLPISRSDAEIELMRSLKRLLDPNAILNPGKVVDP